MGYHYEIDQLEQIVQPYFGKNVKILKTNFQRLTQPGENYGSLMLRVDLTVTDETNGEQVISMVAKMCPPNEWIRNMFNTPVTFKKEEAVYKEISITLQAFETEYGLSEMTYFFPKYYGSRLSLNTNSTEVDDDAVILLENLKVRGYEVGDRFEGFDLKTSRSIVKALAKFHSVALALKIQKPETFQKYVTPNTKKMQAFTDLSEDQRQKPINTILNVLKKQQVFIPYIDRIREYYFVGEKAFQEGPEAREPFATIGHSDFWVNNILINKTEGEKGVKFVDFQIVDYGSPVRDLIFFLYVSVQNEVASKHFDEFINLYYDVFINSLKLFKCDTKPFSYSEFKKELKLEAKASQLFHCLYMTLPIFAMKGSVKPIEELTADDIFDVKMSDKFEPKVVHVVSSFIKNGWL